MSRWRMHKLGFVNFWLYDREEFLLEDGRILLRGANASGKSITTQSFIPFILDGNRSPERLDPFGSRERKMEFYLLGDGEREESTGYLYLEFQMDGLDEYTTVGIGMRAQKGKTLDFWGFCLNDGRRITEQGIQLYETVGRQLIPLSKQKLKNLIGNNDCWAEGSVTYKEMVNKHVFRFDDIRQYDQLIQLLIKVRAPKLSKEAFRPSEVKKILDESLQILTDEDLSAMVSTMERMDSLESTLRDYRNARKDAMIIRNEYERYNQFILGTKGQAYLKASGDRERLQNRLKDSQAVLAAKREEHETQSKCADDAAVRLAQAKAQRAAMGDDDLSVKHSQLESELEVIHTQEGLLASVETSIEAAREDIRKNEVRLRQHKQNQDNARLALKHRGKALQDLEERLELGEEYKTYMARLQAERATEEDHQRVQTALLQRKKQIDGVLICLEKVEETRVQYDDICIQQDQASTKHAEARKLLRDAQQQEQGERDRLTEAFVRRQAVNQELQFSEEAFFTLRRAVVQYRSPADWSCVRQLVDDCYAGYSQALLNEQVIARHALQTEQERVKEIQTELDRLRRLPDPTPPRRAKIETTRALLTMRGIPHAAFYEAVDFQPDLPQKVRDQLEAQLTDAGLLDALLVSEDHLPQLLDLLQDSPDSFFIPGAPVTEPLKELVPDAACKLSDLAARCLCGISRGDIQAQTALLPDGTFRNGALRGRSMAEQPAGFIGATARRTNLERQLQEVEARLLEVEAKAASCQARVDELAQRIICLEEERSLMPTTADLDQALDMLAGAHRTVELAEVEVKKWEAEVQSAKRKLGDLEQNSRALSAGLPYIRTVAAYEDARETAEGYVGILHILRGDCEELRYALLASEQTEDAIEQRRDSMSRQEYDLRQTKKLLEVARSKVQELQAYLSCPENQARAVRLQELKREITNQDARFYEAREKCARLDAEIQTSEQMESGYADALRTAVLDEQELEHYFSEDLALGFPKAWGDGGIPECARQAQGKVTPGDRSRTPEEMGGALRTNYEHHNNALLKYMPQLELEFDSPLHPGMLRQRLVLTLQKDGKKLSLYDFIQALQDEIDLTQTVLDDNDRKLFEDILNETISHKLRARIEESQQWSLDMTALMKTLVTSMGLNFSLDWRAKRAADESEMDTAELVVLLNKNRSLVTAEDSRRAAGHFRTKIRRARETAEERGQALNYADMIREVLDYRTWYEFSLYFQREGEDKKELTDRAFNRFSGGEKAMSIYVPLFAAVSAQYKKGGSNCPALLALDEAFTGVDDKNIDAMFELVHKLDFDYIMNSQALWGCYACVSSLDIAEFHRPNNAQVVTILRYHWNGREKVLQEE